MTAAAFANLCAYAFQVALLTGAGLVLPEALRLKEPGRRLGYFQALLYVSLLLPLLALAFRSQAGESGGATALLTNTLTLVVRPARPAFSPLPWVLALLAAGAVLRLLWLVLGLIRLGALRRAASPLGPLPPALLAARDMAGVGAAFFVSDRVPSPLTFGHLHPAVLLPAEILALPDDVQRCIALHELLHVKHRHFLASLWEEALRSLLWFHPAVWLVLDRIALAREQVVDREVVLLTSRRRTYMETLAAMARSRLGAAAVASLPFFHRSHLLQRLALLTQEVSMSRKRWGLTLAALAGVLLLTGALAAKAFPLIGQPGAEEAVAPAEEPVIEMGDTRIKQPKILKMVNPEYPNEAKEKGIEGRVILSVIIDEKGEVLRPKVLESPDPSLALAAVEAVTQWRYETPMLDGKPVRVRWVININFRRS